MIEFLLFVMNWPALAYPWLAARLPSGAAWGITAGFLLAWWTLAGYLWEANREE